MGAVSDGTWCQIQDEGDLTDMNASANDLDRDIDWSDEKNAALAEAHC